MSLMNRMHNAHNKFQGRTRKVLCVCSAGLLRSPTCAHVLSGDPWNFNTRAVGIVQEMALIPLDSVLVSWADDIVVMEQWMADHIYEKHLRKGSSKPVHVLNVPDNFEYRNPELINTIKEQSLKIWPR